MYKKYIYQQGFTLLEVLVSLGIILIILFFFGQEFTSFFYFQDKQHAREDVTQQAQRISALLDEIAQTATKVVVQNGNKDLLITGNPCRLFRFNDTLKQLEYAENSSVNCTPPIVATSVITTGNAKITALSFTPVPYATDAASIQTAFTVESNRPFTSDIESFTFTTTLWNH